MKYIHAPSHLNNNSQTSQIVSRSKRRILELIQQMSKKQKSSAYWCFLSSSYFPCQYLGSFFYMRCMCYRLNQSHIYVHSSHSRFSQLHLQDKRSYTQLFPVKTKLIKNELTITNIKNSPKYIWSKFSRVRRKEKAVNKRKY